MGALVVWNHGIKVAAIQINQIGLLRDNYPFTPKLLNNMFFLNFFI
jgi:hypothetical protein